MLGYLFSVAGISAPEPFFAILMAIAGLLGIYSLYGERLLMQRAQLLPISVCYSVGPFKYVSIESAYLTVEGVY